MKKLILVLAIAFSTSAIAQNILWDKLLQVKEGYGSFVLEAIDNFYPALKSQKE